MKSEFYKSYSTDLFSDEDSGSIEVQFFKLFRGGPTLTRTFDNRKPSSLSKPTIAYTILLD